MVSTRALLICVLLGSSLLTLTSCQSVQFYQQAIAGQTKLLWQRQDTSKLLSSDVIEPALRQRLESVAELLSFADSEGLASHGAYSSYVETGQSYVIWNVFAARPYALELKTSCFPIAGCVSYRGYFHESAAREYAEFLERQDYEVYVGGVVAYSTLGWFEDPLLDTFLFRPEEQLAALLFHELAHQLVYVPGDTRFNESVATAVEFHLLRRWLELTGARDRFENFLASQSRRDSVLTLISDTRAQLQLLFDSGLSSADMDLGKKRLIAELRLRYSELARSWESGDEFEHWMRGDINIAKLETVADYNEWTPGLMATLDAAGLAQFESDVKALALLSTEQRFDALVQLNTLSTRGESTRR